MSYGKLRFKVDLLGEEYRRFLRSTERTEDDRIIWIEIVPENEWPNEPDYIQAIGAGIEEFNMGFVLPYIGGFPEIVNLDPAEYSTLFLDEKILALDSTLPMEDLWDLVKILNERSFCTYRILDTEPLDYVYRNSIKKYDQLLVPTIRQNYFLVVVFDTVKWMVAGFYEIDFD